MIMSSIVVCTVLLISVDKPEQLLKAMKQVPNPFYLESHFSTQCRKKELLRVEVGGEVIMRLLPRSELGKP